MLTVGEDHAVCKWASGGRRVSSISRLHDSEDQDQWLCFGRLSSRELVSRLSRRIRGEKTTVLFR